eukprot:983512-Pleurochrysis_carterae.AAC.1
MISYRVQLAKNFGTGRYTSRPPQWGDLGSLYMEMHANFKATLPEDHPLRDDANWARITFLMQGIWTSEPAHSPFKIDATDL